MKKEKGGAAETQEKPTYPAAGEDSRKLQERTSEFLKHEQEREVHLGEVKREEQQSDKGDSEVEDRKEAPVKPAKSEASDRAEDAAPVKAKASAPAAPAQPKQVTGFALFLLFVLVLVLGILFGMYANQKDKADTKAKKDPVTQEIKKDLALKNVVKKDEVYGMSLEVGQVKRRVDGLYITFKATNDGSKQVYFMANTMKMVGTDGKVYLPELGQGDIPMSFTGGGITVGTTEEATLVFSAPKDVEPKAFILENVTNLKNGSWAFQIEMDGSVQDETAQ